MDSRRPEKLHRPKNTFQSSQEPKAYTSKQQLTGQTPNGMGSSRTPRPDDPHLNNIMYPKRPPTRGPPGEAEGAARFSTPPYIRMVVGTRRDCSPGPLAGLLAFWPAECHGGKRPAMRTGRIDQLHASSRMPDRPLRAVGGNNGKDVLRGPTYWGVAVAAFSTPRIRTEPRNLAHASHAELNAARYNAQCKHAHGRA